jgi:hypothetical protein
VFFRNRRPEKGEDLNRKVEKFERRWKDGRGDLDFDRSTGSKDEAANRKPYDSSFVYYDEG